MSGFTDEELLAFVDERLSAERSATLERALRQDDQLASRLEELVAANDSGGHTLGQLWRREGLSCPPRAVLAALIDGRLGHRLSEYLRFHLETIGCRVCAANLADLSSHQGAAESERRSVKIFQSSAGHLRRDVH